MDLIAGVYTHRETYKKRFLENWNKYNKDIELLYNVKKLPLHQNNLRVNPLPYHTMFN